MMTWRVWYLVAAIAAALSIPWLIKGARSTSTPAYPPMCFITNTTDITGYAPATWIERDGLKSLVQKFVMHECLDGSQFIVPWVKQGGTEVRDTH